MEEYIDERIATEDAYPVFFDTSFIANLYMVEVAFTNLANVIRGLTDFNKLFDAKSKE